MRIYHGPLSVIDLLLPDIFQVLNYALILGGVLEPLNSSFIVLIAKKGAANPKDFLPISLIHGIQRILSKILAIRLRTVIHEMVDHNQTGFVRGRQIVESFLYAQSTIQHAYQTGTPLIVFKADIQKAFDTISWDFIMATLRARGLSINWPNWVQNLVLKGYSQVIIN
jgi:Reverse transcriptase (RNA-dependent DNA polymerase)